ncbi:MAG: TonB-dependent receptor [Acidobacteria bacterium]|nr:TonB-dependent receptor [Acidobacteriota bacterium]
MRLQWLALLLAGCAALMAQSELASLSGTVTDPTGAVIPRVTVTAIHEGTNQPASAVTNESGRYTIPSLRPGVYRVSAELSGFQTSVSTGVTLQVNQQARLDIGMKIGEVSERVTVTSEAALLETESSGRGAVIDQRKIVELPLNGRDYNQLATLSPGVLLSTPRLQGIGFKGAFNVNGNRAFQNAFLLDGVDNTSYSNSFRGNNMQVVQPSIDALQEFKIQTNAYTAEFGRSSGALINAVIRSGTNALHGSAYEFHRNRALDANNFFSNKNSAAKPFRLRNQFGGTMGGPIVKNKTFFFGDYEGLRDRVGRVWLSSVPQPIWKRGQFTIPIANPHNPTDTGTDFRTPATPECNDGRGNCWVIPASLIDPVGQRVINVAPAPNTGAPGQLDNNYVHVPITTNRSDQFDVRADHSFSTKLTLFGRYSFSDTNLFTPAPRPGLAEGSRNDTFGSALWRSQGIAIGSTWLISGRLVSDLRFGFSRGNFFQTPPNFGSGCPEQLIGLKGAPADEAICGGLPVMNLTGTIERRIGRTTSVPQFQTPRSYDIRDSVAWTNGNHAFKFGAEMLHLQTGIRDVSALLGAFTFSGRFSAQNGVYQGAVADLLLGFPTRYQQDSNTVFNQWQKLYFFYAQDDWKIHRRLTINYGLRYEFAKPARERDNQWANFDFATGKIVTAREGSLFERALVKPDWNNFAPRIGFAWSAAGKTVVRAAYGVFYNHSNRMGREGLLGFNLPFIVQGDENIGGSNNLKATDARLKLSTGVPPGFVDINKVNQATTARKAQDMGQRTTYVQQWSFGVQQEIVSSLLAEVSYVGNRGNKLAAFRNLNQQSVVFNAAGVPGAGSRPLAGVGLNGDIQFLENLGISNYHSLQGRLEKRFSGGLSLLASYTFGKALTNSADHLSTSGQGNGVDVGVFREPQNPYNRRAEYGLAEFDVKQRFVTSAVWQLPYGKGRSYGSGISRGADLLLGGWEFAPILAIQGGLGLTVTQSQLLNLGGERRSRPNRIGNGALAESQRTVDRYLDLSAFKILQVNPALDGFVPNQAFGNSGVGIVRGPRMVNFDFNLGKTFPCGERHSLQFRAEFFNTFNHANFGVPGVNLEGSFGQITQTITEARVIQFGLKYRF